MGLRLGILGACGLGYLACSVASRLEMGTLCEGRLRERVSLEAYCLDRCGGFAQEDHYWYTTWTLGGGRTFNTSSWCRACVLTGNGRVKKEALLFPTLWITRSVPCMQSAFLYFAFKQLM